MTEIEVYQWIANLDLEGDAGCYECRALQKRVLAFGLSEVAKYTGSICVGVLDMQLKLAEVEKVRNVTIRYANLSIDGDRVVGRTIGCWQCAMYQVLDEQALQDYIKQLEEDLAQARILNHTVFGARRALEHGYGITRSGHAYPLGGMHVCTEPDCPARVEGELNNG